MALSYYVQTSLNRKLTGSLRGLLNMDPLAAPGMPAYLKKGPKCPSDLFLKALLRRQYAIHRFRLAGLNPEQEGRINMYAWSEEGSFKDRSAGIMSMLNVLNALMLVIMFQVLITPPDLQVISSIGPPRDASFNSSLVQVWILLTYVAAGFLLYIVYMSSFLHTSYVVTGEDMEALMLHASIRFYAQTMSTGSFFAYSILMISLFLNGTILYTFWWPVITGIGIALLLTLVVVLYVLKANRMCYSSLPQFAKCDKPNARMGDLLPEWEEALLEYVSRDNDETRTQTRSQIRLAQSTLYANVHMGTFDVDE